MRRFGWYSINRTLGNIWMLPNKSTANEWQESSAYHRTPRKSQWFKETKPKTWVRVTTLKSPECNQPRTNQLTNVKSLTGLSYCWWEARQRCSMATTLIRMNTNYNWRNTLAKVNSEMMNSWETSLRKTSRCSTRDSKRKKRNLYMSIKRSIFCKLSFGC